MPLLLWPIDPLHSTGGGGGRVRGLKRVWESLKQMQNGMRVGPGLGLVFGVYYRPS